ncbi:GAF domain-containing protein [Variovorax sp. ZS18.2.2]|uniref:GAF domain-containing protein n=1 Tax=Variovorax sp. ZS18.2.2 TaxID=2971255 RepID=UPI002151AACF|nr:GAF domain-containing protein [Variovorax sp. ZS18.2.2]MCR6476175.1 GAF domain-containing protein [Variovorax sp. ZS18.2.2]
MVFYDPDYAPDAFEVRVSELLVATPDGADDLIDVSVTEVLRMVLDHLQMDVVFVSEFCDGRRVFRRVETKPEARVIEPEQSSPLEESFCQRVIDGRLPRLVHNVATLPNFDELPPTDFSIGAHLSTPIVLDDGRIYGTLCCFSFAPNEQLAQRDLKKLEISAQLAAKKINLRRARDAEKAMAKWALEPHVPPPRLR